MARRFVAIAVLMLVVAGTHATRGVVKAIDASTLVIVRPANRGEMTFHLDASTKREGTVAVGSAVSVRYREDGKSYIALAISLERKD